jgi:hypothetical protein
VDPNILALVEDIGLEEQGRPRSESEANMGPVTVDPVGTRRAVNDLDDASPGSQVGQR